MSGRTDFDALLLGGPLNLLIQTFEKAADDDGRPVFPDEICVVMPVAIPHGMGVQEVGSYVAFGISDNGRRAYLWMSQ